MGQFEQRGSMHRSGRRREWVTAGAVVAATWAVVGVATLGASGDTGVGSGLPIASTPDSTTVEYRQTVNLLDLGWSDMDADERDETCANASLDDLRDMSIDDVSEAVAEFDVAVDPQAFYVWFVQHCAERARERAGGDRG
jgi:hypothetical protein